MTISTIAQTTLPVGTWNADPVHSQVGFEVAYIVGTFRGTFSPFEATLEVREDGSASLRGQARVEDIRVQDENLTAHLLSPDFFDAERAPEIVFAADAVRVEDGGVLVEGEISIKGTSRPLTLTGTVAGGGTDPWGNERVGLTLTGVVDRTAFGITWNNPLPSGEPALADDVTLVAEVSFVKAA
ncbi:MAG TPA: YceI family protein [Gaiellaceae bacterium]|nr:YceI family protein [Gaiellaceae bacterium]